MTDPSASQNPAIFKEWTVLAAIETDLDGLVYWWQQYQSVPQTPVEAARSVWHLTALTNQADILFTSDRGSDRVKGAVFRAFRDLGIPEFGDDLQKALAASATQNGLLLRNLIKRMRNAFLHRSYDIQEHGDDFAAWGLERNNKGAEAFEGLIGAAQAVRGLITDRKVALVWEIALRGALPDFDHYIETGPQRAVDVARHRRMGKSG